MANTTNNGNCFSVSSFNLRGFILIVSFHRLFYRDNRTKGDDLRATDIQRGRDHRLAGYVALRRYCGLSEPKDFDDLSGDISESVSIHFYEGYLT